MSPHRPGLPRPGPLLSEEGAADPRHPRGFVADRIPARGRRLVRAGRAPPERPRSSATRPAGHAPGGLRLRRHQRRPTARPGLEAGDSGARSFVSVQGSLAMPDLAVPAPRSRSTLAAAHGRRRGGRLLRPDRARLRLQPGRHADQRPPRRRRLGAQRHQDVDHQRRHRRCGRGLGPHRRRGRARLPGPGRHPRVHHQRHRPQVVAAGLGHLQLVLEDCRLPPTPCCPRSGLRPPVVPERALPDHLGSMGAPGRACGALEYARTREQFDRPIGGFKLPSRSWPTPGRAVKGTLWPCTWAG
jgi:hypothetical protein